MFVSLEFKSTTKHLRIANKTTFPPKFSTKQRRTYKRPNFVSIVELGMSQVNGIHAYTTPAHRNHCCQRKAEVQKDTMYPQVYINEYVQYITALNLLQKMKFFLSERDVSTVDM